MLLSPMGCVDLHRTTLTVSSASSSSVMDEVYEEIKECWGGGGISTDILRSYDNYSLQFYVAGLLTNRSRCFQ